MEHNASNIKPCVLAPNGKRCVYGDGTKLTICAVHRLYAAMRNLQGIFGEVKPYCCLTFEEE